MEVEPAVARASFNEGKPDVFTKDSDSIPELPTLQLLSKMWNLIVFSGLVHVFAMLESGIFLPYLYTRVECCDGSAAKSLSSHYNITDIAHIEKIEAEAKALKLPLIVTGSGGTRFIAACDVPAFPTSSEEWSLSSSCSNKFYVQDSSQSIMGAFVPLEKLVSLIVLPISGAVADSYGRKPVLALFCCSCFLAMMAFVYDSSGSSSVGNFSLYVAACLIAPAWEPKDAVLGGAAADLIGTNESNKVRAFGSMYFCNTVGMCVATGVAFYCLRLHVDNYRWAWASFSVLGVVQLLFLHFCVTETLPVSLRKPIKMTMFNPFASNYEAFQIILRDNVLIGLAGGAFMFCIYFMGFIVVMVSYLIDVGFSTDEAVLPRLVGNFGEIVFAGLLIPVVPKIGLWRVITGSNLIFGVGYLFWGPGIVYFGHSMAYVGCVFHSCAFPMMLPAVQTIISQRVGTEHQSKCLAALMTSGTIGTVVGVVFYSKFLYDATAVGLARAKPALLSCFLAFALAAGAARLSMSAQVVEATEGRNVELHIKGSFTTGEEGS